MNAFAAAAVNLDMGTQDRYRRQVGIRFAVTALALAQLVGCAPAMTSNAAPATTPPPQAETAATAPVASPTPARRPSDASLPALPLPGPRGDPPGDHGWQGGPGSPLTGRDRVVDDGEATALLFAAGPTCLATSEAERAVPVRVAGLDGVVVEPYRPAVGFNEVGDEITRAYALAVGDRTLCAYV